MPALAEAPAALSIGDPLLLRAIQEAAASALTMCGARAECVGVSTIPSRQPGEITGMLGVHGRASGFITVNLSQRFAIALVDGLLQERHDRLTPQVVDGVGEITNVIGGGIKGTLAAGNWAVSHITVPSVIVGSGYQISYAKGLTFLSATFEHQDSDVVMIDERLMQISISLMRS